MISLWLWPRVLIKHNKLCTEPLDLRRVDKTACLDRAIFLPLSDVSVLGHLLEVSRWRGTVRL